jgi:ABC-2 type transport system ATP-binding protein
MKPAIEITSLTKFYGKSRGVEDINLNIPRGTIYGFLGPNGAGKTTTISILIGILNPTAGSAKILGKNCFTNGVDIRKHVGFLPGDIALDSNLTGSQLLNYYQNIRGINCQKNINQLAKKLDCDLNKKIKKLSRGNKQKIGLISALMHDPDVLILDEPTSGLDPLIQEQFNEILLNHKKQGKTTFISSHILSEVQTLCDNVAFIKDGKIIADKPITEIASSNPLIVKLKASPATLKKLAKDALNINMSMQTDESVTFSYSGDVKSLLNTLAKYEISDISITRGDLEEIFMEYYKD